MSCMLTTATTTIDRAIMVIGNPRIMIAGKPTMAMIGKSHHRSIPKVTAIISMNHQHESSDVNEYPDDADDTQDGDVCLAYEEEYPNPGYYDDNQDWDDQYE